MTGIRRLDFLLAPPASGALVALSFPGPALYILAWAALIPYLGFLVGRPSWRRTLAGHILFSGTYLGLILSWIPEVLVEHGRLSRPSSIAVFALMLLMLSLFLLPFTLLTRWTADRGAFPVLVAAPGFWVLSELLRNHFAVGGFPWGVLGYSQYPYDWLLQVADVGGIYLVSFLVVMGNCSFLALYVRSVRLYSITFLVLFSLANVYGVYRTVFWKPVDHGSLEVALIQPYIKLSQGREYYARMYFEQLPRHYAQASDQKVDAVILPEAPNPFVFGRDFYFTTFWGRLVADYETPLLFNGTAVEEESDRYFNSAFLLDRSGQLVDRYDKMHLVPFGEYLPFGEVLGFAEALVQEVSSFSPGAKHPEAGRIDGFPFGTLICYEAIFPELSRDAVKRGGRFLVNLTNDSWFGRTAAPDQHFQMAVLRSVETRKTLVRCANSGYSAIVDPKGHVVDQLELFKTGMLRGRVHLNDYRTLYTRWGDWVSISLIIVTFMLSRLAGTGRRQRRKPRKGKG